MVTIACIASGGMTSTSNRSSSNNEKYSACTKLVVLNSKTMRDLRVCKMTFTAFRKLFEPIEITAKFGQFVISRAERSEPAPKKQSEPTLMDFKLGFFLIMSEACLLKLPLPITIDFSLR